MRYAFLAMLITGCTAAEPEPVKVWDSKPWDNGVDMVGNVYPDECRRDLSHIEARIVYMDREALDAYMVYLGRHRREVHLYGFYEEYESGARTIIIRSDVPAWFQQEILHHERCHAVAGAWHFSAKADGEPKQ